MNRGTTRPWLHRVRQATPTDDDAGSILLLTIGYAVLALVAILVCVNATSLYLAQKRLDSLADAASLAAADGFTITFDGATAHAVLTPADVHAQARTLVDAAVGTATLVEAVTPDGVSARVTVSDTWHPPVLTLFVPEGVPLEATATTRTALR